MTNYDYEELRLSKWQIGLTLLFILLLMVSLTLTYNQILKFTKQKPLYSDKEADNILKIYRVIGLLIALGYLIIDVIDKGVKDENNLDTKTADLQIDAGILTVIATIIVLYVAFTSDSSDDLENPDV